MLKMGSTILANILVLSVMILVISCTGLSFHCFFFYPETKQMAETILEYLTKRNKIKRVKIIAL